MTWHNPLKSLIFLLGHSKYQLLVRIKGLCCTRVQSFFICSHIQLQIFYHIQPIMQDNFSVLSAWFNRTNNPQKINFSVLSVYNIKYARTRAWVNCATRQVLSFRKLQDSTQPRRASHSRTHKTVLICALSCTTFYTIFLVQPFQESCKLCHKTATNFRRYSWNAALTGFNPYLQHAFCTSIIFCRYKILY